MTTATEMDENNYRIKLLSAPTTENMSCRLISEDGKIEMGVYPVVSILML